MEHQIEMDVAQRIAREREADLNLYEKMRRDAIANSDYQTYVYACEGLGISPEFDEVFAPRERDDEVTLEMIADMPAVQARDVRKPSRRRRNYSPSQEAAIISAIRDIQQEGVPRNDPYSYLDLKKSFLRTAGCRNLYYAGGRRVPLEECDPGVVDHAFWERYDSLKGRYHL